MIEGLTKPKFIDFKDILDNWSDANMEDLDKIYSSIPRHIEGLNELEKMLSEEKSRRRFKGTDRFKS